MNNSKSYVLGSGHTRSVPFRMNGNANFSKDLYQFASIYTDLVWNPRAIHECGTFWCPIRKGFRAALLGVESDVTGG